MLYILRMIILSNLFRGEFLVINNFMGLSTNDFDVYSLVIPFTGPVSVQIGAFSLVAVLGRGKFGKVFLAEHKQSNAYVAFKTSKKVELLRESNVDCLRIEKRILQIVTEARNPFFVHMLTCLQQPVCP